MSWSQLDWIWVDIDLVWLKSFHVIIFKSTYISFVAPQGVGPGGDTIKGTALTQLHSRLI
jgi:hypothetical protein